MPAYMISQVTVTDQEKFKSYIASTRSVAAKYGAKPVAVGAQPKILNGENDGHQMVFVIEFESMEKLDSAQFGRISSVGVIARRRIGSAHGGL